MKVKKKNLVIYLANINNSIKIEKFKLQFFKRKDASSIVKNSVKSEKSILTKRLSEKIKRKSHSKQKLYNAINDDDMFILGKKNNNNQFKLNFGNINIIKEHNNEEGSVNNSPYLRNLKETKVVKTLFSKFDKK